MTKSKDYSRFENLSELIFYSYANLQMLQAALSLKKKRYDRVCYMIRSKALKAYKSGTWHIHDLFQNNIDKIKSENYCWYCGKVVENKIELTIDHVIPRAKGGSNEMNNIIMVCKHCNSSKGDRDLLEWFFEVKRCFPPLHVLQHYLKQIYDYAQKTEIMSRTLGELDMMELPFNYKLLLSGKTFNIIKSLPEAW